MAKDTAGKYRWEHRTGASLLLSVTDASVRRRSGLDALRLICSVAALVFLRLVVMASGPTERSILNFFRPVPLGLSWLVTSLWMVTTVGVLALLVVSALVAAERHVVIDVVTAAGIALVSALLLNKFLGVISISGITDVSHSYPTVILSCSSAATLVALAYLSRGMQRLLEIMVVIATVTALLHGSGLPLALLASIVLGWGSASLTRLAWGSPVGLEPNAAVVAGLGDLGIMGARVEADPIQRWGVSRYLAQAGDRRLRVSLYGRDARESQLLAKLYRTVMMRDQAGSFAFTRAQQLEHECYLTLLFSSVLGDRSASLVTSGFSGASRDAYCVTESPQGKTLREMFESQSPVDTSALTAIATMLADLHAAGLAHGEFGLDAVVVEGSHVGVQDLDKAVVHASESDKQRDIASLLVTLALISNAQAAMDAARSALGDGVIKEALSYLQDAALPVRLSSDLRHAKEKNLLKQLREQGATAVGVEIPELAKLRRIGGMQLVLAIGTFIGGWALIGVFLKVVGAWSTLTHAEWAWVVVTALIAQLAYLSSAFATLGSITKTVPLKPLIVLELSNTFSGLALGTPAVLAARVRFFQKRGIGTTEAVSSGVLESTVSWIVKGVLALVSIPFAISTFHIKDVINPHASKGTSAHLLNVMVFGLEVVVGAGILIAIAMFIPRARRLAKSKLAPKFGEVRDHLKTLAKTPSKMLSIFGGTMGAQLVTAFALSTALMSFHQHLSLPVILVVLTFGSILGGVSPVPGGMGVVEAGMILGLRACGVDSESAVAAVFIQRLFTAYLPPMAGWVCLMWLRKKSYL